MELVFLYRVLLRNKWIIAKAVLATLVIAFLLTFTIKEKYKSQAQISTGFTLSQEIVLSDNIFDQSQINVKFNNVIENITSPKVLNLLAYRLILRDLEVADPFSGVNKSELFATKPLAGMNVAEASQMFAQKYETMQLLNSRIPKEKQLQEILDAYGYDLESLKENLEVKRLEKTDYIDITFLSTNAELSEFVVNTIVKEFLRYYDFTMRSRSIESILAIDSIVDKRKNELDLKVKSKMIFMRDSFSARVDPSVVNATKISQSTSYETSLAEEIARQRSFNYQIEEIDRQLGNIPESAGGGGAVTADNTNRQYAELRRQYNDQYEQYVRAGSNDPVKKAQLDDLQKRMQQAAKAPNANVTPSNTASASQRASLMQRRMDAEAGLKSSNSKIAFYRGKLAATGTIYTGRSSAANSSSARLEQLDKEIELATAEYMNAKDRSTKASSITDTGISNFKQTLFGQVALNPEPTNKLLIVIMSGFGAGAIACIIFIIIAMLDQSIRNPEQFNRLTGLPLMATINFIDLKGTDLKEQITSINSTDSNRSNVFREFFRKFRYEVEKSGKRVILFTSTEPQQGKTTLTQALALSLSLSNKKVLIIDTNFCNNDLTVYNSAKPTLENFESKDAHLESKELNALITPTRFKNVDIIGCRGGDYTPSEILPKNHVLNFLPDLLKTYDFIFMEGAPLTGFTDTRELAKYAEGIIAIFSASLIFKHSDKESIKFFKTVPDKFIGAVLNKVESQELNIKKKA